MIVEIVGLRVILREDKQYISTQNSMHDARLIFRRIGLPSIASLGLIVVVIGITLNNYNAIYGLVIFIAASLISACWNVWLLLVD
jgi:small neutral amino acid transporter SnatA (MarC family)